MHESWQGSGVTEDMPLWDEEDALDSTSKGASKRGGAATAKKAAAAATGAVIPSAKKAKAKAAAAKNSEAAAKVCFTSCICCVTANPTRGMRFLQCKAGKVTRAVAAKDKEGGGHAHVAQFH